MVAVWFSVKRRVLIVLSWFTLGSEFISPGCVSSVLDVFYGRKEVQVHHSLVDKICLHPLKYHRIRSISLLVSFEFG